MSVKSNPPALYLGEFELLVLLAILRLDDAAYGVTIRDALERDTSREVALGAIYKTLGRLEDKGYLSSRLGDPTPERGGRARRYFALTPLGLRTLRATHTALTRLSEGLESVLEES